MARQTRESDLQSLHRRRMYAIFAPLDPVDRLPRELLDERPAPRGMSLLARRTYWPGRKELAAAMWLPAALLLLAAAGLGWLNAPAAFVVAGLLAASLIGFAIRPPRERK